MLNKLGREANTKNHFNYWTNRPTIIFSLLGAIICWALFPLLTRDISINEVSSTTNVRIFSSVLAMSSAAVLSIFLASFKFGFRLVTLSILGAGVSTLSSTAYISNPVYAIVFGLGSAIAQYIFCSIHDKFQEQIGIMDHNAYVFIGQGFLGIFF